VRLVPERDPLPRLLAFVYAPMTAGLWWVVQRGWLWPPGSRSCVLLETTGVACPTCGGVRAVRALGGGHVGESLRQHPLVVPALALAAAWLLYAAAATVLPRWRRSLALGPREARALRLAAGLAFVSVWAYQILRHL